MVDDIFTTGTDAHNGTALAFALSNPAIAGISISL